MRRKIPSIEALIAFEAAARHQSFTRSADELALTQSAVGRQIACLEDYVGVPLFSRIKKRLALTDVGRLYARQVRESLEHIERDTLAAMAQRGADGILELAVIPTFATRWLIPRLPGFYKRAASQASTITLNLTTRAEPFLFDGTGFDAAIHFGNPVWPGTIARHLFGEELIPVCSPGLAQQLQADHAALSGITLLHQSARPHAWRDWLEQAGMPQTPCMHGQRYELFSMLVEAARAGLGLALVPRFFVLGELGAGELAAPFAQSLRYDHGYYLVYPEQKQSSRPLKIFESWLLEMAGDFLVAHE